eukprot:5268907-Prymnesium_polylepis.1
MACAAPHASRGVALTHSVRRPPRLYAALTPSRLARSSRTLLASTAARRCPTLSDRTPSRRRTATAPSRRASASPTRPLIRTLTLPV